MPGERNADHPVAHAADAPRRPPRRRERAAAVLRPELTTLADEIVAAIAAEVPAYSREMQGPLGQAVRAGTEFALGRFVDVIVAGETDEDETPAATYRALGRGEHRYGRSLDALLSAYRVGARVAWRGFVRVGTREGLEPETLFSLGEAIFAYIDEISAASAAGYAEEGSAAADERLRRRRRLLRLLSQRPPAEDATVRAAAEDAGWPLPRALAALVPVPDGDAGTPQDMDAEALESVAQRVARRIGPDALGGSVEGMPCVLVPDPGGPGRAATLQAALRGGRATLGPAVPGGRAAVSIGRAIAAARLVSAGSLHTDGVLPADEHLLTLALHADPALAAALAARVRAPLAELTSGARDRLLATLRAWLDRPGQIAAIAAQLQVHPQTVRYRVRQLRELYGDALDDPERRLELAVALRAAAGTP